MNRRLQQRHLDRIVEADEADLNRGGHEFTGSGSPEGVVVGWVGNRYTDKALGSAPRLWLKRSGDGTNTGWVQVTTGANGTLTDGSNTNDRNLERLLTPGNAQETSIRDVVNAAILEFEHTAKVRNAKGDPYLARGDGTTNDSAALQNAISAGASSIVYLPAGTYRVANPVAGLLLTVSNTVIRGAGASATTIKANTGASYVLSSSGVVENVVIEDITFDGNGGTVAACIAFYGAHWRNVTFRRCRFVCTGTYGVIAQDSRGTSFVDCEFITNTPASGNGVQFSNGLSGARIVRCKFLWLANGILVGDTGDGAVSDEKVCRNLTVDECEFEGGWWALPARAKAGGGYHSGAITSVTNTVLTVASESFPAITSFSTVRLAHKIANGTTTTFGLDQWLVDANATFNAVTVGAIVGLRANDYVVCGNRFAIIVGTDSTTTLRHEGWLDLYTRAPTDAPGTGSSYTVYRPYIGTITASTATTLTVRRWHDLIDGATYTGATLTGFGANLTYDLLPDHPSYSGIHSAYNTSDISVVNSRFWRSWADQISLYGDRSQVIGNQVWWGYDTGITINGQVGSKRGLTIVVGNQVHCHGAEGIWIAADNGKVADNLVTRSTYENNTNNSWLSDIVLAGSPPDLAQPDPNSPAWLHVTGNTCDGFGWPWTLNGILVATPYALVHDNICRRHTQSGIYEFFDPGSPYAVSPPLYATITDNACEAETTPYKQFATIANYGGSYYDIRVTGTPSLYAMPGSFARGADGKMWKKVTAFTSNVWEEIGSGGGSTAAWACMYRHSALGTQTGTGAWQTLTGWTGSNVTESGVTVSTANGTHTPTSTKKWQVRCSVFFFYTVPGNTPANTILVHLAKNGVEIPGTYRTFATPATITEGTLTVEVEYDDGAIIEAGVNDPITVQAQIPSGWSWGASFATFDIHAADASGAGTGVAPTVDVRTAAGPYTVPSDRWRVVVVNQTVAAAFTMNLNATPTTGDIVEPIDGKGDAATYNITVNGNGKNINGAASFVMNTDRQAERLVYTGTEWVRT